MKQPYSEWLAMFEHWLLECGMPVNQIERYRTEYSREAKDYYFKGVTPSDAAVRELMP